MDRFAGVDVVKKANIYFDGKVTSRTIFFENGSKKTLGIMMPGGYEFDTSKAEIMEISSGKLDIKLPNSDEWIKIIGGQSFSVPANCIFGLKVYEITDYCCSYID